MRERAPVLRSFSRGRSSPSSKDPKSIQLWRTLPTCTATNRSRGRIHDQTRCEVRVLHPYCNVQVRQSPGRTYAKQLERERGSGSSSVGCDNSRRLQQQLPSTLDYNMYIPTCRTKTVPVPTKCVAMECSLRVLVLAGTDIYVLQSSWRLVLVEH